MEQYLYETHMHTAQGSACGASTGAEMAEALYRHGYAGAVVTDHFFNGNCRVERELPWEERVRQFAKGYEDCRDTGSHLGLTVWFGFEWAWHGLELLVHGLTPEWLIAHPDCDKLEPAQFSRLVRDSGGFLIHAHPFRQAPYIRRTILLPTLVDAVEIRNGGNGGGDHYDEPEVDRKAIAYAAQFGFRGTAGSDVHRASCVFGFGTTFPDRLRSHTDLIDHVRDGRSSVILPPKPAEL